VVLNGAEGALTEKPLIVDQVWLQLVSPVLLYAFPHVALFVLLLWAAALYVVLNGAEGAPTEKPLNVGQGQVMLMYVLMYLL
jgi:hypothetical protein